MIYCLVFSQPLSHRLVNRCSGFLHLNRINGSSRPPSAGSIGLGKIIERDPLKHLRNRERYIWTLPLRWLACTPAHSTSAQMRAHYLFKLIDKFT